MARYQTTVQSQRPAAETFAYLAIFSNAVAWDPGVLAGEQLDPGPVRPGTRFRLVVPARPRESGMRPLSRWPAAARQSTSWPATRAGQSVPGTA